MTAEPSRSVWRFPLKVVVRAFRFGWELLPEPVLSLPPFRTAGGWIHRAHVKWQVRYQSHFTRFLRNAPLCEVLRDLVSKMPYGRTLRLASFGCSTGAELYTLLWYLRTARPDLHIFALGTDIVEAVVQKADRAEYLKTDDELAWLPASMFPVLFDSVGAGFRVKEWLRSDTRWLTADATNPELQQTLQPVDLLLANNFLGPMPDHLAEACMENLLRLVVPGGYIVLDGVDLDLKTRFVQKHGLVPICDRMDAINRADRSKEGWPWKRWATEPIEQRRPDWQARYAVVFATAAVPQESTAQAKETSMA